MGYLQPIQELSEHQSRQWGKEAGLRPQDLFLLPVNREPPVQTWL